MRGDSFVDAASSDLSSPLGMNRREPRPWRTKVLVGRGLGAACLLAIGGLALYVTFVDDPLGGEPHALVPIEARTPAAPPRDRAASAASRPDGAAPAEPQARASATEVEAQSGVAVVR